MTDRTLPQASPPGGPPAFILPADTDNSVALAPKLALLAALNHEQHLTKAADAIGVPQPTASRWLAELGEDLGTPLLTKDGRRIRLTRAGKLLAEAAERSITALEAGLRQIEEELDPERGKVVLGFLHMLGREVIPELVRDYRQAHPHVRFGLVQNSRQAITDLLRRGDIDLALVAPPPEGPEFDSEILLEQELIVIVPENHPKAGKASIQLKDLEDDDFIALEHGYGLRQIHDELCAKADINPRIAFESQEMETIRGLVAAGLGVAVLTHAEHTPKGVREIPLTPRS